MITTQDFFPHTSRREAPHETTSFTLSTVKGLRIIDFIGLRAISYFLQSYWGSAKSFFFFVTKAWTDLRERADSKQSTDCIDFCRLLRVKFRYIDKNVSLKIALVYKT